MHLYKENLLCVAHLGLNKMADIMQISFLDVFSSKKSYLDLNSTETCFLGQKVIMMSYIHLSAVAQKILDVCH